MTVTRLMLLLITLAAPVFADEGVVVARHANGNIKIREMDDADGRVHVTEYYETGIVRETYTTRDGKFTGTYRTFAENGYVLSETQYVDGLMEGEYRLFHPNKKVRVCGRMKRGKREGTCTEFNECGLKILRGEYSAGLKQGPWQAWGDEGDPLWSGQYERDLKSGQWYFNFAFSEEIQFQFTFDNNERHGRATEYFRGGKKRVEKRYVQGRVEGIVREWHESGTLRSEYSVNSDKFDGKWRAWHANGKLAEVRHYKAGFPVGSSATYYENGSPRSEWNAETAVATTWFENGQMATRAETGLAGRYTAWFYSGHVREAGPLKFGIREGRWSEFHESGEIAQSGDYSSGIKSGPWVEYQENGNRKAEGRYAPGKRIGEAKKIGTWRQFNAQGEEIESKKYE